MTLTIGQESIKHASCILTLSRFRVHILLLVPRRDKAQLYQTARHRREAQHSQIILLGTHILTTGSLADILLHILGQFDAVLHVLVLDKLKHDIALGRVRVVAMIGLLIVLLEVDHSVLTFSHLQVLHHTRLLTRPFAGAQRIGLEPSGNPSLRQGVDVERNKEVGLSLIGDFRPSVKLHKLICLTRIDHLHVRTLLLHQPSEGQRKLQRQVLLVRDGTLGPGVAAAMSGIDHQRKLLISRMSHHGPTQHQYS